MKLYHYFIKIYLLLFLYFPGYAQLEQGLQEDFLKNSDTIYFINTGNHIYFSDSIYGKIHIHSRFNMGTGIRNIDYKSFSWKGNRLNSNTILENFDGIYEIPRDSSFKINDLTWDNVPLFQPDTTLDHRKAIIFDSYFSDKIIEVDNEKKYIIQYDALTYIPEGHIKYEVIYILDQPFILTKTNINGCLYTEWFRFDYKRGISSTTAYVSNEIFTPFRPKRNPIVIAGKEGFENATSSIIESALNESKMFYKPSDELQDMSDLTFTEKAILVEDEVTIYCYDFRCEFPKANIFLIHGNGGNVSTYKNMIKTLVKGNYNVYVVDWRGYGKSTGNPEYKGVLKDTEIAFNDFLSQCNSDSLKVIIYGMSLGGQIATKLTSDRQHDIDALVLDGSLCSAQSLAMDFVPVKFVRKDMKKRPDSFNQDYIAENDIKIIDSIPKLIIHSEVDKIVKLYHGERLYENAQEPKFFWKTNTRHIFTLEELPEESINKLDQLLQFIYGEN